MCGICGEYNYQSKDPVAEEDIRLMTGSMVHRGPDDEGYHISGPLGLGFRRLSIIDLKSGQQPMSDREGKVWVVSNGEIYNFPELRKELEGHGHVFRTNSDTEVIVHGYKQWGNDVLKRLNGIFGMAIWDENKKKLILARDRLGIKPLYYQKDGRKLAFASEIRALHSRPGSGRKIDPLSLNQFLRYRYVPAPNTLFEGISKLAPGTMLVVENGGCRIERWWLFKPSVFDPLPSIEEAEEELHGLYSNAIKRQLISDVPVGLLLSGGLDSGLILGFLQSMGSSIRTYTVGFEGDFERNELKSAARSAELMGFDNISVELDQKTYNESLSKAIAFTEEPIASPAIVPMYHVSKRARQDVKVVLTGQGPDELIAGYKRHVALHYGHFWRQTPGVIRNPLKKILGRVKSSEALIRGLYSLDVADRDARYEQILSILASEEVNGMFKQEVLSDQREEKLMAWRQDLAPLVADTDELGGFHFYELSSSLPEEQLIFGDKMSMAHGLEARVPFLDHDIVEYVTRLPASYKVRWFKRKYLHKRICERVLPKEIINRGKIGFATPVDEWFSQSMNSKLNKVLLDPGARIYEYLDYPKVRGLITQHIDGRRNNHKILFNLVVCELCIRN